MPRWTLLELTAAVALLACVSLKGAPLQESEEHAVSAPGEASIGAPMFNVRAFGAVGDGAHVDTAALQAAIDTCSGSGGGTVLVPSGKYLTGTLMLKSNVNLHVVGTATVLGSTDLSHYATAVEPCGFVNAAHIDKCLLYAADAENISLTGRGVIDGQGGSFASTGPGGKAGERPMLARFVRCRQLFLTGLTLKNAGAWCSHFLRCAHVRVQGLTILNRAKYNCVLQWCVMMWKIWRSRA